MNDHKMSLILYQKLQDEVDRLNEYHEQIFEIINLIKKREDVSSFDQKYKSNLASQICIKIEEYKRQIRKLRILQKAQKSTSTDVIEDVYWKGISYHDLCRIERELKEKQDKEKIKQDIQQRRIKL